MAVTYGFFNSINGDRKYNADQMSDYFRGIVNQGVFQHLDNGLAVSAGTGMKVNVATGRAIVQNKWIQNDMALPLTIEAASDTYGRKDAVVIRLSYTNRSISIVVKTGTPAASPTAPSMTRNSTTYEMALAYVNVSAGATSVTVTDKRSDTSVCGWATVAQETSGEVDAMLEALKTGFDGVLYSSPAAMVQGEDQKIFDAAVTIDPVGNYHVNASNTHVGNLTDMNTAVPNMMYYMVSAGNIKTSILNLPDAMPLDGANWYAVTYGFSIFGKKRYIQYLYNNNLSVVFRRYYQEYNTTWTDWEKIIDTSKNRTKIIVDINGNGDYTSFSAAIAYAYSTGNVDILIKNGTYDITQEVNVESSGTGAVIGNGTKIYCESDVVVKCEYTGSNTTTRSTFSILNAGNGDFEINDIKLVGKNIRYCVHDELGSNVNPYHHIFKNCTMSLDNRENPDWSASQCIGGGLGSFGIIEVTGGFYTGYTNQGDNTVGEISYHNNGGAGNSLSKITIKDVYFQYNTARFGYYGPSTKITKCYVSGCSMPVVPLLRPEVPGVSNVNMELLSWGNEIRS